MRASGEESLEKRIGASNLPQVGGRNDQLPVGDAEAALRIRRSCGMRTA